MSETVKEGEEPFATAVVAEAVDLREVERQVVCLESVQDACFGLRDHLMGLRQLLDIVEPFGERVLTVLGQADPQHVQDHLCVLGIVL